MLLSKGNTTIFLNLEGSLSQGAGIGRQVRLKIWCPLGRAGSIPALDKINDSILITLDPIPTDLESLYLLSCT